jgi:hypothetical protein
MDFRIEAITPYNSFVSEPNWDRFGIQTFMGHYTIAPFYGVDAKGIPNVIEQIKLWCRYFKGKHTISVRRLIKCEPYEIKIGLAKGKMRDWVLKSDPEIEFETKGEMAANVTVKHTSSFGSAGWSVIASFPEMPEVRSINPVPGYYSTMKWAKKDWFKEAARNSEISHWRFVNTVKARHIKCKVCKKPIFNLTAKQCSECGRFLCDECMGTEDTCSDCSCEEGE